MSSENDYPCGGDWYYLLLKPFIKIVQAEGANLRYFGFLIFSLSKAAPKTT